MIRAREALLREVGRYGDVELAGLTCSGPSAMLG